MKKGRLKIVWLVLLVVVFLAPQTYKTWHIFSYHHGHLDCHGHHNFHQGINTVDNHCPICKLTFTFFETDDHTSFSIIMISNPAVRVETSSELHTFFQSYNYYLRAPPIV